MAESSNAKSYSLSLYDNHKNIIEKHKKKVNIRSDASAVQDIIEKYWKLKHLPIKKDLVLLVIYPIVFCVYSLYNTIMINRVVDKSLEMEYIFVPELKLLQAIFSGIGFITVGFLAMGFIIFYQVLVKRYGNQD